MKKGFKVGAASLAALMVFGVAGCSCNKDDELSKLPAARLAETAKGQACNSNDFKEDCSSIHITTNLYKYLGREDTVYIDLRNYDQVTQKFIDGFRFVEFFDEIYGTGTQLFIQSNGADNFMPRYQNSVAILEAMMPKDKNIFLMCAAGSRVVNMMKIMEVHGWDMSRVYNVGGMNDINATDNADVYGKYTLIEKSSAAITFKTGTDTETWQGHTYTTYVNLTVDTNNKITTIYVTGTAYTTSATPEWNPETWIKAANDYAQKLVGKTKAELETMLGQNGASGNDVVAGATLSSNRVLRAAVNALNAQ